MFIRHVILEILRCVYWFPFRMVVQRLPIRAGYTIATVMAFFGSVFMRKRRYLTGEGLCIMFAGEISEKDIKRNIRKTFENVFKNDIEVLWYPKLTPQLCDKIFTFEGLENLDKGLEQGRGVVLLHGHFGNPHMIMPALGFKGYKLNQLGSRNPPERINDPFMSIPNWIRQKGYEIKLRYKEALPVNFIYTDKTLKAVVRSLKNNEVLAVAIDGREGSEWIEIDFLKQKALFSTGAMSFIIKMMPVVLPSFVIRQDDSTHKVVIHPPMDLKITGDKEKDIRYNMESFLSLFEKYIFAEPSQYGDVFWFEDRYFKRI